MNAPAVPPPITEDLRAQARRQPGGWVYVIDPAFDPAGRVPGWGIQGGFRVDADGELTGEYRANPDYRPSPQSLRLPEPANRLEAVLQRAATGHGPEEALIEAIVDSELILFSRGAGSAELFMKLDNEGRDVLQAFTSDALLPAEWSHWQRATGRQVARALAGKFLELNPGNPVSVTVPGDDLVAHTTGS